MSSVLVDDILSLADFHGFDVDFSYPDGEVETMRAVTLNELRQILSEVFDPDSDS